jgi:predicted metal-dependent phosphoesterase TrpH
MKEAQRKGLNFVGICDHNSVENVSAAKKAGEREKISVIGGMEVTSREEVHILALFDEASELQALQQVIYENLPGTNDERMYGDQVVVNEDDEVIGFNKKLLMGATEIPLYEIVELIHRLKGLAIASHIDREGFGIIGKLGFIPEDLRLDAVEFTVPPKKDQVALAKDFPAVVSSDAHVLEEIGRKRTRFLLKEITVEELGKSFRGEAGRRVIL